MISTATPPTSAANKVGGGGPNKGRNKKGGPPPQSLAGRRHSPAELDRAHSVDGGGQGPVPLRRSSYAFDHAQRHHQKASTTPPYHPHHLHQPHPMMNGVLAHQHSAPVQSAHHQDSSDCGSSSGLGGMGTPVKGESGCSISSSSNNSVVADFSHDSRDSGGPISSPGATIDGANGMGEGANPANGHRSLVATATLTPNMVSSQQTTTISPVSSIPTLVQQQPVPHPQFSAPPPGLGHHPPSSQQFGAFPPHHHHQFPTNNNNHHNQHHSALLQHHPAAAVAQFNALHAAAAAMLPPASGTPPMPGPLYAGGMPQKPPNNHWNQQCQQKMGAVPMHGVGGHQQQQHRQQMMMGGRAMYTMTCECMHDLSETAALASVGAAALTAGYHVTLEPCASAPPIIPPAGGIQGQPTAECIPPPPAPSSDFNQAASENGTAAMANEGNRHQQQGEAGEGEGGGGGGGVGGEGGGDGGMTDQSIGMPLNGGGQQQQQMSNGPTAAGSLNNIMPPGVPPEIAAAISGGHDLFVHIHPGDAIALAVGNEIQHIHGPATIRMVSQSAPPSAIPMNVPPGHVVQQLLDRQGYLSHIIMSQEMPPAAAIPTPPGTMAGQQQQQAMAQMQIPSNNSGVGGGGGGHPPYHTQNSLQPPLQRNASPQKSATPSGRFRPSPSSSASPPNTQLHALHPHHQQQQQQQFVLAPQEQSHHAQHHQQQQLLGSLNDAGGYGPPNPLNKWSPRGGPFQPHFGGRKGGGPANALGSFYIEPASQQLIAASQSPPTFGQHPQAIQQANFGQAQIHQQFAGAPIGPAGMGAHQIGPFVPGGGGGGGNTSTQQQQQQGGGGGQTAQQQPRPTIGDVAMPLSIEEDEKERLRDALSSLQPPIVTRVGDRDADVVWQELDTSEAAASVPGFPEINQSEFAYQLILYEQNVSTCVYYKTDANSGNVLHLQRLRPATEYMICIRADLPGHGIIGYPSAYATFRTHSSRPDPPIMPKMMGRQATTCSIQWRIPNCNGPPIQAYSLQMAKGKSGPFETIYEGPREQTIINGLEPGGFYRFRVYCRNEIGQSDYSPQLNVYPERNMGVGGGQQPTHLFGTKTQGSLASPPSSSIQHPPSMVPKPAPPTVLSVAAKAVKLSWNDVQPGHYLNVTLEMLDFSVRGTPHFVPIPAECYANSGTFANVNGLQSNREYRFRLAANTSHGETIHSEFVAVRTRSHNEQPHYNNNKEHRNEQHERHQQQEKPQGNAFEEETAQIEQRVSPAQSKVGQKKSSGGDGQQQAKKAQKQTQPKAQQSQGEEEPEKATKQEKKAPNCSTPKFTGLTSESAKVTWRLINQLGGSPKKGNSVESLGAAGSNNNGGGGGGNNNAAMMFELQRVDRQQPQMVFSGNEAEFELKGLKPVEHLQLRVRAVLLDTDGKRCEGDWSLVGSACTLCAPPSAPRNVRPMEPDSPTTPGANMSGAEEEETRSKKSSSSHQGGSAIGHSIAICWDPSAQLNGASITEYTVHAQRFSLDDDANVKPLEERLLGSTTQTQFHMARLQPAQRYLFTICAHNEAGTSPKSEPFDFISPPGVPDTPRDFHAEALSTSELQLSWTEPIGTNGSPITSYHVNCYKLYNTRNLESSAAVGPSWGSSRQRQLVSQQIVPSSQRLLLVQSLDTETDYELVIQAENGVGKSGREIIRCATLAEPPSPPEMALAQATANTLKLKWNPLGDLPSAANHYYYLERENENGTYSPVYEGDLRTAKVKGLRERTIHHFRIRAAIAKGLMIGPWSKRHSFQTTRQPPTAPKQAPIAIELAPDLFQLEWSAVRCKEQQPMGGDDQMDHQQSEQMQQFIYRLQIAPKVLSSAKEKSVVEVWKNVYEGTATQCTVPVPNASQQARQARLFIVQQFLGADGQLSDECVSTPSPITVFSSQKTPNESPKKRPIQGGKNAPGPSTFSGRGRQQQAAVHYPTPKEPKMSMYKRLKRFGSWMKKTVSEKDCALIVLFIFVILAFGIAILLNNYYLN